MTCRTETANQFDYRYCPEDPPPAADRIRVVLRARVVDEITQQPLEVDATPTTHVLGLTPRSAPFGRVGLVGRPGRLFPGLDVNPVDLDLRVQVPGYLPLELGGVLGPIAGFPDQFAPLDLGNVGLHRTAVVLRGRTVQRGSLAPTVVANATVGITGYWPTFPPATVAPAAVMQAPNFANISQRCYAPRAAGVTSLRARPVTPVPGENKTLLLPAARGDTRLRLSARSALVAGTVLVIDPGDPGRRERIPVAQIDVSSSADQPAWITLVYPLAHTHREGVVCEVGNLGGIVAGSVLTRAAGRGDETIFLAGVAGLVTGAVVEIDDGVAAPEYHEVSLYSATSDGDGFFQLPPIARVAMVLINTASPPVVLPALPLVPPDDFRLAPDYRSADNRVTVTFP